MLCHVPESKGYLDNMIIKRYRKINRVCKIYKKCALYYINRASFAPYIEMLLEKDLKYNWCKVCADKNRGI